MLPGGMATTRAPVDVAPLLVRQLAAHPPPGAAFRTVVGGEGGKFEAGDLPRGIALRLACTVLPQERRRLLQVLRVVPEALCQFHFIRLRIAQEHAAVERLDGLRIHHAALYGNLCG